ncbi:MAG TPA: sterol desaturase family protein [Allosphingosinicella sp.]|jgi:beta-carotene 3-hydroxylase
MAEGWIFALGLVFGTVVLMEALAWAVHRHVMHGWGWGWHRSHHEPSRGRFETNDLYALAFAALSLLLFTLLAELWAPFWWVGVGTVVYGLLYALLHDGLVHRRLGFDLTPRNGYLKRLVQAHRLHHAVRGRDGAVSFGFLYAPPVRRLRRQLHRQRPASFRRRPGSMNTSDFDMDRSVFMDPGSSPG